MPRSATIEISHGAACASGLLVQNTVWLCKHLVLMLCGLCPEILLSPQNHQPAAQDVHLKESQCTAPPSGGTYQAHAAPCRTAAGTGRGLCCYARAAVWSSTVHAHLVAVGSAVEAGAQGPREKNTRVPNACVAWGAGSTSGPCIPRAAAAHAVGALGGQAAAPPRAHLHTNAARAARSNS
jgi:hypothetical protein